MIHYVLRWDDLPPSMNDSKGSGYRRNHFAAARAKKTWEGVCMAMLLKARVPRNYSRVIVAEMVLYVPDRRRRDAGNYRMLIEKCLGDCLQKGGWLPDDTPEHYSFRDVRFEYVKGERAMELRLECS